ncbi:MAG: sulfate adenylyltransferase [Candidatus Aureabacteria bacterium]|nr:sulfate adenylyltransferase [Candidatus Auribacterota bacterium]
MISNVHGGRIVEKILGSKKADDIKKSSAEYPNMEVTYDKVQEILNITTGVFSPLEGFMNEEDYKSVIIRSRLASDIPWTIPIVLDITGEISERLGKGDDLLLTYEQKPLALMKVEDIFSFDKTEYSKSVFGTDDRSHPGVRKVFEMKDVLIGGTVELIEEPKTDFYQFTLKPKETRVLFKEKGWQDVVGFQTRNVPHLGHEYVQKTALSFVDGLFINPVIGRKKKGDFKDEAIIASYQELMKHYYLKERAVMAVLHTEMRYAGPKEAIHHAIMRKNFGCTHFIIGRDHAGVGSFYDPFAAHRIFDEFPDLGIVPIFFSSFFYCKRCSSIENDKTCPHPDTDRINFSGTKIRDYLVKGEVPPESMMRKEVSEVILSYENPFVE